MPLCAVPAPSAFVAMTCFSFPLCNSSAAAHFQMACRCVLALIPQVAGMGSLVFVFFMFLAGSRGVALYGRRWLLAAGGCRFPTRLQWVCFKNFVLKASKMHIFTGVLYGPAAVAAGVNGCTHIEVARFECGCAG